MENSQTQLATFGGGCFWCVYAMFKELKGVHNVLSGYAGDDSDTNPDYKKVCEGKSKHAEVIQLSFDPTLISYETLLKGFFYAHDPCSLNKQGEEDVGIQYRSIILYHDQTQKDAADKMIVDLNQTTYDGKIVTLVEEYHKFYSAEDYHQDYFEINPNTPYCSNQVRPKVLKFLWKMKDYLKDSKKGEDAQYQIEVLGVKPKPSK